MRFSLALPADRVDAPQEFLTGEALVEIAGAAERCGFDAVFASEHPIPEAGWLAGGGHHTLDPFVALAFAAAGTRSLRLQTNLCVLPYHDAFLAAKAVATLDALSGGRVVFGVGAGYLEAEFRALGADFARRNEACDEALARMKRVWSGEGLDVSGGPAGSTRHASLPRPLQQPHPPIWVGGNSRRAIRRAVEHGQGWMPMRSPPPTARAVRTAPLESHADLREGIAYARGHAERIGRREPLDVQITPFTRGHYGRPGCEVAALVEEARALADLGVTWLAVLFERPGSPRVPGRARYLELVEGFGSEVIRALARS